MRLYLHWPFCRSRCTYCDFNARVAGRGVMDAYRAALVLELDAWARMLDGGDRRLASVYIGGGTPSTLSGAELSALLAEVRRRFILEEGAEVTAEVNPACWTAEDFRAAHAGGVSRFSIGVQSLRPSALRLLGRAHSAHEAREAVSHAMRSGARTVSVDLLYGLPAVDLASLQRCLDDIIALGAHHLSLYPLTLSAHTPLARAARRGAVSLPTDDEVAEQYMAAVERLCSCGYEHYEIANFCLRGHRCEHNLAYWRREQYLGVGAGAHSLLGKCRFFNTASVLGYVKMMSQGVLAVEGCELLDAGGEREEEVMLALRTSQGVPRELLAAGPARIEDLEREGLLAMRGGRVVLTHRGMFVSNAVIIALQAT